jgi:16S rRNA (guanine966-N2)-methyltransferase
MKRTERSHAPGRVRIIAGRLRGSRIDVPAASGLRPSADRVRETLFNWLAPHLHGAHCLDLFAGSGALGFEAASRGAARVTMLERDPHAAAQLRATAVRLGVAEAEIIAEDALRWLGRAPQPSYGIAFVDPPFDAGLHQRTLEALAPWLAPEAWIYVESARDTVPTVAPDWQLHREGHTREVRYALYRRCAGAPATLTVDSQALDPA